MMVAKTYANRTERRQARFELEQARRELDAVWERLDVALVTNRVLWSVIDEREVLS